jgi:hypothetical protein
MFETVYALWGYWDGPREGVADYRGRPHVFVSEWNEEADDYGGAFLLRPIDDETFRLVMEDRAIHRRWKEAVAQGLTTFDTHPASKEDWIRTEELKRLLQGPLTVDPARAKQSYPVRTWLAERPPAVSPVGIVRLTAEFRHLPGAVLRDGHELPSLEVRWSTVA